MKIYPLFLGALLLSVPVGTTQAADYAPCAALTGVKQYQCRRFEAISEIRAINLEFRKDNRQTIQEANNTLQKIRKSNNLIQAGSNQERQRLREELGQQRYNTYQEWKKENDELLAARRNLRTLTRLPNNKELRMELVKLKGEYLDAKGNLKKTRRTVVEEQLEYIKKYRNIQ